MVEDKNTEKRIFDAARRVFLQKGLAGARMQEIADEAGINKALLHYYFRTKEKLFEGIFNDVILRISSGLSVTFEKEMDVLGRIRALVDIYIDVLSENRYLPLFVLNEMSRNPDKFANLFVQHVVVHMQKFIFQILEEVKQGKINPIHPVHLLLNVLSLIIFPFAALPVMTQIIEKAGVGKNMPAIDMDSFLKERKQIVYEFIENALVP
jgi:TetR/AcrR family transcriptional regulator